MTNCKQMLMGGGKPQTPKVRDERIDSVKYWLIVLVIAGHVFMEKPFTDYFECDAIWKWITIFHMPLFVFISGYLSHKLSKNIFYKNIWKLLEPLLIFQTLSLVTKLFFKVSISIIDILSPWYVLWYLLSLIYWRSMIQIIPNKILNSRTWLIVVICISILSGFLKFDTFLSAQRTLAFMPFFFFGYYIRDKKMFDLKLHKIFCLLFLLSTFYIPLIFPQLLGDLTHSIPYYEDNMVLQRITTFIVAIFISIAFINICPVLSYSSKHGKYTMQYYIYHALIITPFMILIRKVNIPAPFISATICTILIIMIINYLLHFSLFKKLTNPSSFIKIKEH